MGNQCVWYLHVFTGESSFQDLRCEMDFVHAQGRVTREKGQAPGKGIGCQGMTCN